MATIMKILYILLACLLIGCNTDREFSDRAPINQPPPVEQPPPPEPSTDFAESYNVLFDNEISKFDEDKQKHAVVTKGLFWVWDVKSKTDFGIAMESFIKTQRKGYDREMGNIEIDDISNAWDQIEAAIQVLDYNARLFKLDSGDLNANLFGAGSSLIIFSDGNLDK